MPPQNINDLRKACKHLMVDLGLDRNGSLAVILPHLSQKMGKPININTLVMALSGYRETPAYQELLAALHDLLNNWPQQAA